MKPPTYTPIGLTNNPAYTYTISPADKKNARHKLDTEILKPFPVKLFKVI